MCDRFHYPYTPFGGYKPCKTSNSNRPGWVEGKINQYKDLSMLIEHITLHLHGKFITN